MAKKVKNDWLGGRVDEELKEQVEQYLEDADITQGQFVRLAAKEYLKNHPVEVEE